MRRVLLLAAVLALAAAAPARAGWFPAQPLDAGTTAFGGADLARDGTGAVVYVKPDGVHLVRWIGGAPQPPVLLAADPGASDATVAVADGGIGIAAWRSGNQVLATSFDPKAVAGPVGLGAGTVGPPAVDMAIQHTAHVVFAQDGDIRAVRWRAGQWQAAPAPLDIDPARTASDPHVAVAADGNALVVWVEDGVVYARRLTDLRLSAYPQQVSLAGNGPADAPDVQIEDDVSFAWVVWRQDVDGTSRTFARRLVGSLFDPPAVIDLGPGARAPRVSMNGDGAGLAVSGQDSGDVAMALLAKDRFAPAVKLGTGTTPLAVGAESRDAVVAWQAGGGWTAVHAAHDKPFEAPAGLGAGGGPASLTADRAGDALLAWRAGDRVVAALWDEAPGKASLYTTRAFKATTRPRLRWGAGRDLWGAQQFRVVLDGKALTTTTAESVRAPKLADGTHRWRVVSIDPRNQQTASKVRYVRVDTRGPDVSAKVRGRTVRVSVTDAGAGVRSAWTAYGDGAVSRKPGSTVHRYARAGRFTVTVRAADAVGHVSSRRMSVRAR